MHKYIVISVSTQMYSCSFVMHLWFCRTAALAYTWLQVYVRHIGFKFLHVLASSALASCHRTRLFLACFLLYVAQSRPDLLRPRPRGLASLLSVQVPAGLFSNIILLFLFISTPTFGYYRLLSPRCISLRLPGSVKGFLRSFLSP